MVILIPSITDVVSNGFAEIGKLGGKPTNAGVIIAQLTVLRLILVRVIVQ